MPKVVVESLGRVRVVRINRPEVHNCVDAETAELLTESIDEFANDENATVLIVTGEGDKAFCSGADLKSAQTLLGHKYSDRTGPMGFSMLDPGKPTIAAVNGYCFAGGMELAAWCDFRIASENAEFGALNRRWGVPFTDGGTQRFARIAGIGAALYLIETGVRIDSKRALQMGLVQEIVGAGLAFERALEIATRICEYPSRSLVADRKATIGGWGMPIQEALLFEREVCLPTTSDPELVAGLDRFVTGDRPQALR